MQRFAARVAGLDIEDCAIGDELRYRRLDLWWRMLTDRLRDVSGDIDVQGVEPNLPNAVRD